MTCPQDCTLTHQHSRSVLPWYRAPILGRYEKSARKPIANAVPVEIWFCPEHRQQWMRVEKDGVVTWTHPGDKAAVDEGFAAANVSIQYPREFFLADLLQELEKWASAIKLDLGLTFEHYIKNRVVDELAPELPTDLRDTIRTEIEGQQQNREQAMVEAQARFGASMGRIAGPGKKPEPPKPDAEPADKAA